MAGTESRISTDNIENERVLSDDEYTKPTGTYIERVDNEVLRYANAEAVEIDESTNKRLLRQINRRVLPVMALTYLAQGLDKGVISFASIMGLIEDVNLHGQQYSWLTTVVYLAMLAWEFPTNWIIQRVPIGKYLSFNIVFWGIVVSCQAACNNFAGLVACRVLMGFFETCCQPIFVFLSSMWYKREEQAAIIAMWYGMNGVNQIIGGLLAYCFSLIQNAHIAGWRIYFLTYGCATVVFGMIVCWWLPDSPMAAKCWPEEDKTLMVERVRQNQNVIQSRKFRFDQLKEGLTDPQTWCYALIKFCVCLPSGGLGAYQSLIIKSFGFSVIHTQLLGMVQGVWILIVIFSGVFLSRKTDQTLYVMMIYPLFCVAGTIVLVSVVYDNTVPKRAGLLFSWYLTLSYWGTDTLGMSLLSRNVGGQTKKATAVAMTFVANAAANSIGPQVFLSKDKPRYVRAFVTHIGLYGFLFAVMIYLRIHLVRENKRRDRLVETGEIEQDVRLEHAFEDFTDKQKSSFRYSY